MKPIILMSRKFKKIMTINEYDAWVESQRQIAMKDAKDAMAELLKANTITNNDNYRPGENTAGPCEPHHKNHNEQNIEKIITSDTIKNDIILYNNRISLAETKISSLPIIFKDKKHKNKIKKKRIMLENEIRHVQRMINIAEEYLE